VGAGRPSGHGAAGADAPGRLRREPGPGPPPA
jgi:hypothetical protein